MWTSDTAFVYGVLNFISSPGHLAPYLEAACPAAFDLAQAPIVTPYHNSTSVNGDVAREVANVPMNFWGFPKNARRMLRSSNRKK